MALVLAFVGFKLVADIVGGVEVPTLVSLGVVIAALGGGVGLSLAFPPAEEPASGSDAE